MALLPAQLPTTSRVRALPSGMSTWFRNWSLLIACEGQRYVLPCILMFPFMQMQNALALEANCWSYVNRIFTCFNCLVWCRRTVVSIPNGPSALAVKEAAWGLARYAATSQVRKNTDVANFNDQSKWFRLKIFCLSEIFLEKFCECRTMGWSQLWSQKSFWMVNMESRGHSRLPRRCGQRCSSAWRRTMCCSRGSSWSPVWLPLVLSARTRPPLNKSLSTPSSSSTAESPLLSPASWQVILTLLENFRVITLYTMDIIYSTGKVSGGLGSIAEVRNPICASRFFAFNRMLG